MVPIETVSDIKLDGCFAGTYLLQHRRRSLKFGKLNEKQKQQIEAFIQEHGKVSTSYGF